MPAFGFSLSKGLREPCSPYREAYFFGAALNSVSADNWNCLPQPVDSTTEFNLASISINREVVVAALTISGAVGGSYRFTWRWVRIRDERTLFQFSYDQSIPPTGWAYGYSYIGWTSNEISENGSYRVEVAVTGPVSESFARSFGVSGVTVTPPPPTLPPPAPVSGISEALNSVASYLYGIYQQASGWIWPFSAVAPLFYYLSSLFGTLALLFSYFITLVNNLISRVAEILSWNMIWELIQSYVPNLTQIRDWFYSWWYYVSSVVISWWEATGVTVQGWINIAVQPFNTLLTAWNNFWNSLWPQLVGSFYSLRSAWENFWLVTLPTLVSYTWLGTWWVSRLLDVMGLIDSSLRSYFPNYDELVRLWGSIAEFAANPLEYLWQRFADWFLGPEE